MSYRDVTRAWTLSEFRAAARKRYGVFEREGEQIKVDKREPERKTERPRRIVGRRTS